MIGSTIENRPTLCVHHLFEQQCERTPDAIALVHGDDQITYSQLNFRANSVASKLQALGVSPDSLVGLLMERSIDMVAGLFGILKAGGAYVPLDPSYPSKRIANMLEDCSAKVVLTQESLKHQLPIQEAEVISIESIQKNENAAPTSNVKENNLAYVIFTSGSTGRPKGVMVEHRNVCNFFAGMDQRIGTQPGVWLAVTSISFDISVLEIFWTLGRGYKVVLQEELSSAALQHNSIQDEHQSNQPMDFGLFFFSSDASKETGNRYQLLLESTRFADENGFTSVWTPERHFHKFGGLFPNPAVTGAALAAITKHIQIRAGSCVLPLHHPIRVAEEWAVVDNLSNGRAGLSFAPGWHPDDFALRPENYLDRKQVLHKGIDTVKALWRGETVKTLNANGEENNVRIFPPPIQDEPPIWITTAGNIETFKTAGEMGANILTNLLGQSLDELTDKIIAYRASRKNAGHSGQGQVTLMLHTFVGEDDESVKNLVREPFKAYLRTATDLVEKANWDLPAFRGSRPQVKQDDDDGGELKELTPEDSEVLMEHAFERYFNTSGLFGSLQTCLKTVNRLKKAGVTEIGCLIDFGVSREDTLASLPYLNQLRQLSQPKQTDAHERSIAEQIELHRVTHLQCTPSLAQAFIESIDSDKRIKHLHTIILGGETLPQVLAERFLKLLPKDGKLMNMYGPTETTIWSTVATISKHEKVTIGTPILNTNIHVLDTHMETVPIGMPGELYIGGAGVTRGYLNKPELTQQHFVPESTNPSTRMYRTGDLVRQMAEGHLEFLGRTDHQVKLNGHRIELGEIETALCRSASIKQAVVTVRENLPDQPELVAYLRKHKEIDKFPVSEQVTEWQTIWHQIYEDHEQSSPNSPSSKFAGWTSSYNGKPIPIEEMEEWLSATVENIAKLKPKRILEIGCGTGLLLFRLARQCERYSGVDFCTNAIQTIESECKRLGLDNVELAQAAADDIGAIPEESFDVVVINSVIQYFPNADYLEKALTLAVEKLTPGGHFFVGDVRNLDLQTPFHISAELEHAPADLNTQTFRKQVAQRAQNESELLVAPDYFKAFTQKQKLAGVAISLKRGSAANEMTNFRYDVVARKNGGSPISNNKVVTTTDGSTLSNVTQIRTYLSCTSGPVRITNLLNARLVESVQAEKRIHSIANGTVSTLRAELAVLGDKAIHPNSVFDLDEAHAVHLSFSTNQRDRFDADFVPKAEATEHFQLRSIDEAFIARPLSEYVSSGSHTSSDSELSQKLLAELKAELPDYTIPSTFVYLDAFPLTPNGKIDRKSLPMPEIPEKSVPDDVAPEESMNDLEQIIAQVFKDLLKKTEVRLNDNFFDLGANSLMMIRAANKLQNKAGMPVRLRKIFEHPTVASLSAYLKSKG